MGGATHAAFIPAREVQQALLCEGISHIGNQSDISHAFPQKLLIHEHPPNKNNLESISIASAVPGTSTTAFLPFLTERRTVPRGVGTAMSLGHGQIPIRYRSPS
jgi:hypothetical protein